MSRVDGPLRAQCHPRSAAEGEGRTGSGDTSSGAPGFVLILSGAQDDWSSQRSQAVSASATLRPTVASNRLRIVSRLAEYGESANL